MPIGAICGIYSCLSIAACGLDGSVASIRIYAYTKRLAWHVCVPVGMKFVTTRLRAVKGAHYSVLTNPSHSWVG